MTAILDGDPGAIRQVRSNGRRPLTAAVEFGHRAVVKLLLARGADPKWPESGADRGAALRIAVDGPGDRELVELLLAHGADPNSAIDSAGSATMAAPRSLRPLLLAQGGIITADDAVWLDDDDELVRRAVEDPSSVDGGIFTTVVTRGKRDLLQRLLDAGVRPPAVLTACQGYLLDNVDMLRTLLAHGMSADLMNWQHQTLLHLACAHDRRGRKEKVAMELVRMVEFLLGRGAPTSVPDDEPWATPLAWAERRGHTDVVSTLRRHGATR